MKRVTFLLAAIISFLNFYGQGTWKEVIVDNSLSLSSPFEMKSIALDINAETEKKLEKYITTSGQDSMGTYVIMAVSALYKPEITANLENALKAVVDGFKENGEDKLTYEKKTLSDFGVQGLSAVGHVENVNSGKGYYFYSYFYGKQNKYWNVLVLYENNSQENIDRALQVIRSIRIKPE